MTANGAPDPVIQRARDAIEPLYVPLWNGGHPESMEVLLRDRPEYRALRLEDLERTTQTAHGVVGERSAAGAVSDSRDTSADRAVDERHVDVADGRSHADQRVTGRCSPGGSRAIHPLCVVAESRNRHGPGRTVTRRRSRVGLYRRLAKTLSAANIRMARSPLRRPQPSRPALVRDKDIPGQTDALAYAAQRTIDDAVDPFNNTRPPSRSAARTNATPSATNSSGRGRCSPWFPSSTSSAPLA